MFTGKPVTKLIWHFIFIFLCLGVSLCGIFMLMSSPLHIFRQPPSSPAIFIFPANTIFRQTLQIYTVSILGASSNVIWWVQKIINSTLMSTTTTTLRQSHPTHRVTNLNPRHNHNQTRATQHLTNQEPTRPWVSKLTVHLFNLVFIIFFSLLLRDPQNSRVLSQTEVQTPQKRWDDYIVLRTDQKR